MQELLNRMATESQSVIEGVKSTVSANDESSKSMKTLATEIKSLDRIVSRLKDLNLLTNVLAVTGRVEAARAGEHGFAFETVSSQIREFVEQSGGWITEIGEHIQRIQEVMDLVASAVQSAGVALNREVEGVRETTGKLRDMQSEARDVENSLEEVRRNAVETVSATEDIKKRIDLVAQGAEMIASACQEASAAVDQQTKAMKILAAASEEIAQQADEL
jgi:methyl-accepting chemotaxis protein